MVIDSRQYGGKCVCGREHAMSTRCAVIESGCLGRFEELMEQYGVSGRRCVLYDENTYRAVEGRRPRGEQTIVLDPEGLHANERATALVLERLEPELDVLVSVGSGTVHDIGRYCAFQRGLRFVSVPTGASVDGFCSNVAAMTWYGFKKTLPAVSPELVVADVDIIKAAPPELVKSGVGDILAKFTALADWRIAHVLTGEYLCPRIHDIVREAADTVVRSVPGLLAGESGAYADVTYALVMSGLAMQMMGNSRPASGAEHHISHLIEELPAGLTVRFPALHGEKTGVGAVLASEEYHRMAQYEDIKPYVTGPAPVPAEDIRRFFGPELGEAILKENEGDCLAAVTPERLVECWPQVREIVAGIPSAEELRGVLERLDAKRTPEDVGVTGADVPVLLDYSPYVRDRLTLMRVRRMLRLPRK